VKFIRLVVGNPKDDIDTLTGVFSEAALLQDKKLLSKKEAALLQDTYDWFNDNLPCPPWSENNWEYGVSWFKKSANQHINKMWNLANLLKEHNKPVRMLKADNPGKIVYQDDFQVIAVAWVDVSGARHNE
jgi:hypothetical protein